MGIGPTRDDASLVAGFARWLSRRGAERTDALRGAHVVALRRPSSGWTNETVVVELADAPVAAVVVRMPAVVASFPDPDVGREVTVLRALAGSSVPVPAVLADEEDAEWLGAPFVVMEHVAGRVIGDVPAFDEWLTACEPSGQRAVHETFVRTLAAVHALDRRGDGVLDGLHDVLRRGLADELDYWSHYVDWAVGVAGDGVPTPRLVAALEWCRASAPSGDSVALLWGDARLGNVIWRAPGEVGALIDWEGATLGPPEMDLGWYLALDALTTHFARRTVPGFLDRAGVVAAYERALGRAVTDISWHEVFALVRSVAINECQARLAARAGRRYPGVAGDENPVLDYMWSRIDAVERGDGEGSRSEITPVAPR